MCFVRREIVMETVQKWIYFVMGFRRAEIFADGCLTL
jgi:hypothetical protein